MSKKPPAKSKAKELEEAYTNSTLEFLRGEINEGEYQTKIRYVYREVLDLRKKGIKKLPRFVAPINVTEPTMKDYFTEPTPKL